MLIFYLHHMLMDGFIVLIYNFNRNFVKCTSGGFDPAISWSLISALDHSSTLPTYLKEVKKSIIFQSLALLLSSVKTVDKSCTFPYFYRVNLQILTVQWHLDLVNCLGVKKKLTKSRKLTKSNLDLFLHELKEHIY